jgi:hypothetical protein
MDISLSMKTSSYEFSTIHVRGLFALLQIAISFKPPWFVCCPRSSPDRMYPSFKWGRVFDQFSDIWMDPMERIFSFTPQNWNFVVLRDSLSDFFLGDFPILPASLQSNGYVGKPVFLIGQPRSDDRTKHPVSHEFRNHATAERAHIRRKASMLERRHCECDYGFGVDYSRSTHG